MFFLLRMGFWLSLVLLALPFGLGGTEGASVGPFQALMAARDAVGDLAGLCERKPDVCETGKAAIHTVSVRAREGGRIAFDLLDRQAREPQDADAVTTGSVGPAGSEESVVLPDHAPLPPR